MESITAYCTITVTHDADDKYSYLVTVDNNSKMSKWPYDTYHGARTNAMVMLSDMVHEAVPSTEPK